MTSLLESLPDPFQADLNQIRTSVDEFGTCYCRLYGDASVDPITWADHALALLEAWLQDDEQQHVLRLNPWDVFRPHASAYLCDIGLPDAPNAQCPASDAPIVDPNDAIDGSDISIYLSYNSTFGFHEPVPPAGGLRQTQLHLSVTKTRYGRPANSLRSNSAGRCSFAAPK